MTGNFVVLNMVEARPFLARIVRTRCDCGFDMGGEPIRGYPHSGGWRVEGYKKRLWLYVTCPNCKYQWAIWKLGVPRNLGDKTE